MIGGIRGNYGRLCVAALLAAGSTGTAEAAQTGRIYFVNRSPDQVEVDIVYYVDKSGTNRGLSGTVKFEPFEKSLITYREEAIYASKVRFKVTSKFGTTTWTSAPENFDKDGDLLIYHARDARPVVYHNRTGKTVTLKGDSYIDERGLEVEGPWTWTFARGERAPLAIDGEALKASRFDYTVTFGSQKAEWYVQFDDRVDDQLIADAGYIDPNARTTAYGPSSLPGPNDERRAEKIKF